MSNITKYEDKQKDLEMLKAMAIIALKSEKYEGYNESTILNIFLTARALGVDPMIALQGGFNIIKGKISMGAHFMAALARRAGHSIKVVELTTQKCIIIAKRKDNDDSIKYEMTMDEAAAAGLTGKQNWRTNPKQMLYCACVRNVFRMLFSDIAIAYDADEMNVEGSTDQLEGIELASVDVDLSSIGLPARFDCKAKEEPCLPLSTEGGLSTLKTLLEVEEIPTDKVETWIDLRAGIKNKSREETIQAALSIPSKFKEAFVNWLQTQPSTVAV